MLVLGVAGPISVLAAAHLWGKLGSRASQSYDVALERYNERVMGDLQPSTPRKSHT
jgi:hypothetical protein